MKVCFDGIGEEIVTFEAAEGVQAGTLVKVSGLGQVAPCTAAGDVPVGVVRSVRAGICGVQTRGYMLAPSAVGLTVGFALLSADKDKKLAAGTSGRPGFVLYVDEAAGVCGVLF